MDKYLENILTNDDLAEPIRNQGLESLIHSMYSKSDAFFILSWIIPGKKESEILLINSYAARIIGRSQNAISGENFYDFIDSDSQETLLKAGPFDYDIRFSQRKIRNEKNQEYSISGLDFMLRVDKKFLLINISTDITLKNREDEILRRSESHYRNVIKNIPSTNIYLVNKDLNIILAEGIQVERYNSTPKIFQNKQLDEVISAPHYKYFKGKINKALAGDSITQELSFDKEHFSFTFSPAINENQEIFACLIVVRNITREKQLNRRMNYMSSLVETSDNYACIQNTEGKFLAVNKSLVKDSGFKDESDFIGKTYTEVFGDLPHIREYIANSDKIKNLKPGESITFEEDFHDWRRDKRFLLTKRFPVFDDNKKLIALASISTDITKLKKTRSELFESEKKYKLLVENQDEGIGITDLEENFTYANPKADEIFRLKRGELTGRNLSEFMDTENFHIIGIQTNQRKEGTKSTYEIEIRDAGGEIKTLLVTATPQFNNNKKPEGTLGIFRDITLRKKAEEALIKSQIKLKEADIAKNKFFSIIAHDLKNPFNSILGFSQMLLESFDDLDDEKKKKYIKLIYESSMHSESLLNNLLHWSRSQIGRLNNNSEEAKVYEIAESAINLLSPSAEKKKISISNKISREHEHLIDVNMISTVLRNLISNAIKFTYEGGEIVLTSSVRESEIDYIVKDNGIGISPENQKKLFRLDDQYVINGTAQETGTGLGLILCREFVEKNGGMIRIESKPGKGTSIIFTLPL